MREQDEFDVDEDLAASIMIRVLIAAAQFMAEVPTNEQGYPNTTVSDADSPLPPTGSH